MSSFSKYTLIEKGELDRLRQKQVRDHNPTLMTLANLKDKMDDVLVNEQLGSSERVKLFDSLMSSFQTLKQGAPLVATRGPDVEQIVKEEPKIKTTKEEVPADQSSVKDIVEPTPVKSKSEEDTQILEKQVWKGINLANRHINSFNELKKYVDGNPGLISKNKKGELVLEGKTIPNSNFDDLVRNLYYSARSQNLTGRPQFLSTLKSISVPLKLIKSKDVQKTYSTIQQGKGSMLSLIHI